MPPKGVGFPDPLSGTLNSKAFKLRGEIVASELAEAFAIAGETLPAGTAVRIDLTTGTVAVAVA